MVIRRNRLSLGRSLAAVACRSRFSLNFAGRFCARPSSAQCLRTYIMMGHNRAARMVFPLSHSIQTRRLLLRNNSDTAYVVKLVPSSRSLLVFSPLSENKRSNYYVDSNSTVSVKMCLDQSLLSDNKQMSEMEKLRLMVYCTKPKSSEEAIQIWLRASDHPESELVQEFSVVRSKEFSALETLIDLPGQAHLVNAVFRPSMDVDDSDCLTAHRIDSDTHTVIPLTEQELMATLPPNSMIQTSRLPFSFTGMCSWVMQAMATVFPTPTTSAPVSTPPVVESKEDANNNKLQLKEVSPLTVNVSA